MFNEKQFIVIIGVCFFLKFKHFPLSICEL